VQAETPDFTRPSGLAWVSDRGVSGAALEKTYVLPKSSLHINNDGKTVISGAVITQNMTGGSRWLAADDVWRAVLSCRSRSIEHAA
jgi:hypothetical protein